MWNIRHQARHAAHLGGDNGIKFEKKSKFFLWGVNEFHCCLAAPVNALCCTGRRLQWAKCRDFKIKSHNDIKVRGEQSGLFVSTDWSTPVNPLHSCNAHKHTAEIVWKSDSQHVWQSIKKHSAVKRWSMQDYCSRNMHGSRHILKAQQTGTCIPPVLSQTNEWDRYKHKDTCLTIT